MRGSEFAELKAFAAVVERASFARAADHLGLSPSALSQTIRQLEARLGVRLLNRTTRSVAPTAAGSRLHERIAPMMLEMAAEGPLISNHQDVVVDAALQGLGILYAYDDDRVHGAIERGQLKCVLDDWLLTSPGLYLYYSNRHHPQPALRAFIDCLLDRDEIGSKRRSRKIGA